MKTTISRDAAAFLETVLFAYPGDDEKGNALEGYSISDFSPEFTEAVANFCEAFRAYLYPILSDDQFSALDDSPRSFGGNVYFSLSGHGAGFRDDSETEHLPAHLEAFSGDRHRFEGIDLSEDENGKLDLSFLPEFLPDYRRRMFTPAILPAA